MNAPPRHKVLVIDDDEAIRQLISKIAAPRYDVFTAPDVPAAELILARQDPVHIILCDHIMPGENGLDYCRRLRDRHAPGIRILITGNGDLPLVVEALNSRALFRFVPKPFTPSDISCVLEDASREVERQESARQDQRTLETLRSQEQGLRGRIRRSFQIIFGLGSFAFATLLAVMLALGFIGIIGFLFVYFVKSALGIDILPDKHLRDWF